MTERTFFMVKPDAMRARVLGKVLAMIESGGLTIVAGRIRSLSADEAQRFYAVHKERPFFGDLVKFMTSGPVFTGVLEGDDAIKRWRDLMGPTDSKKAPKGPVRGEFGTDGDTAFVREPQAFKIPTLSAAYDKVGMFGMKNVRSVTGACLPFGERPAS